MSSQTGPLGANSKTASCIEFELSSQEFILHRMLSRFESVVIEPARNTVRNGTHRWSSIWIRKTDRVETGSLLIDDPDITACSLVLDRDDEWLYQIKWDQQARERIDALLTDEATLQAAVASDGHWTLRVSVPQPEGLKRLYEQYEEYGFDITVTKLCELEEAGHSVHSSDY